MATIFTLLLLSYLLYRLVKPKYEKKWGKELRFRDIFNPEYWDKM